MTFRRTATKDTELAGQAHHLRHEDVIEVEGKVSARVPGTENPNLATGDVELVPEKLRILNRADVLPFPLDAEVANEDLRLSYRYFDLRRPQMARNLRLRHKVTKTARDFLDRSHISRPAKGMDDDDRLRPGRDGLLNADGRQVQRPRVDIHKDGHGTLVAHGVCSGNKRERWHDDFVAFAYIQRADAEMEPRGSRADSYGMRYANVVGYSSFELDHLRSQA